MPTDGTQIAADLNEMRANIERAINDKRQMAMALINRGATGISTESTIKAIGDSACNLIDGLERGELTSAIRFHINPPGAGGYIPPDGTMADALDGAHILLQESGTTNVWRIPINSIEDSVIAFDNTFTKAVTTVVASVVLGVSGLDLRSKRVSAVITPGASVDITLTTYVAYEDTFEIGRVFPISETDTQSYLITATTNETGARIEQFGCFDASGVWVSDTGITAAVPELNPETGTIDSWSNGPENGNSFANIWPWSAVRRETFTVTDSAGTELNLEMAGFRPDAFYGVKLEERDMVFNRLNADGTVTSTTKACRILWIARPHLPGYEMLSSFYSKKWVDNGAGGLAMEMSLSKGLFWGSHKGNTASRKVGSSTVTVLTTGTIGSTNTGGTVAQLSAYASALNQMTNLRDTTGKTYGADTTGRRFAATNLDTYMAWWHLFVVQFGMDAQTVFQGITTDAGGTAQSKAGVTDALVAAGHLTGSVGDALGQSPFVYLGIENFGYGSEGDALCDVSLFSGRDTDDEALCTRTYVQPDRSRYTPGQGDIATLTAAGYLLLTTRDNDNTVKRLCGRSDNPALRDMHMPTRADDGFLNAKSCDTLGGIYRTGAATGNWVLSAACLFGHRGTSNAGGPRAGVCALGWYVASGGPSNSGAAHFGARVSLLLED